MQEIWFLSIVMNGRFITVAMTQDSAITEAEQYLCELANITHDDITTDVIAGDIYKDNVVAYSLVSDCFVASLIKS